MENGREEKATDRVCPCNAYTINRNKILAIQWSCTIMSCVPRHLSIHTPEEWTERRPGLSLLRAMRTEKFQTNKKGCQPNCSAWTFSKFIFKTHAKNGKKNNADSLSSFETAARVIDVYVCPRRAAAVICLPRCLPCHFHGKLDGIGPRGRKKSPSPSLLPGLCTRKVRKLASSRKLQQRCSKQRGTQKSKEWYLKNVFNMVNESYQVQPTPTAQGYSYAQC